MNMTAFEQTHAHIEKIMPLIRHEAAGFLRYPYLTVTFGAHYGGSIFCWDNHHMTLRFAAGGEPEQMRYFVDSMLSFQTATGYVPCMVTADDGGLGIPGDFHAQPFLAQNTAIYVMMSGDVEWAATIFSRLEKYLDYWRKYHSAPFGLYRWRYTYMSGFDNEITGTMFPPDTIISPDLNAWLYLELRSMAFLAEKLGLSSGYVNHAEQLKKAINDYLWDEDYGTYASYDLCSGKRRISWTDGSLPGTVGYYAFLSCSSLIPLFARIASKQQARRMIERYVISPLHFRSPYGIRSLSCSSEYYNNACWGNPPRYGDHRRLTNSNWQGPVWIPLNWFVFHALLFYGFNAEAEALADDTFKVIAMSVEKLGFMRENFHAETGAPLYADNFASWNILADLMPEYLPGNNPRLPLFVP